MNFDERPFKDHAMCKFEKAAYNQEYRKKEAKTKEVTQNVASELLYGLDSTPPFFTTLLLGFQHYVTMFGSTIAVPFLLAPYLCIENNAEIMSKLISAIFFVSGISTLIQVEIGCRLPIIQGATFALIRPTTEILSLDRLKCSSSNADAHDWTIGMREVQGAIIAASFVQLFLGLTGLVGFVVQFIGPLTYSTTVLLIGLSLVQQTGDFASDHWGFALMTVGFIIVFSHVFKNIAFFRTFPILLALLVSSVIASLLTHYGYTHTKSTWQKSEQEMLRETSWFHITYPGQWGMPNFNIVSSTAMVMGMIVSIVESIGNYVSCAKIAGISHPPKHAVNRGIAIEGIASIFAGFCGSGNGTTSYSENIAAIGVTRVASRRVIQMGAIIMIALSLSPKISSVFVLIPRSVIGGVFWVLFGMIFSVGIANLESINLKSHRNLLVLGFSTFNGMVVPNWVSQHPDSIHTGYSQLDQIIRIFCCTNMLVGGATACILDNILPNDDGFGTEIRKTGMLGMIKNKMKGFGKYIKVPYEGLDEINVDMKNVVEEKKQHAFPSPFDEKEVKKFNGEDSDDESSDSENYINAKTRKNKIKKFRKLNTCADGFTNKEMHQKIKDGKSLKESEYNKYFGRLKDRKIAKIEKTPVDEYELPCYIGRFLVGHNWPNYIPFLPPNKTKITNTIREYMAKR